MLTQYQNEIAITLLITIPFFVICIIFLLKSNNKKEAFLKRQDELKKEGQEEIREGLRIIALAVVQNQCDLSEGCWRIRMLLERYESIDARDPKWKVFYEMFNEIRGFSIKEDRQKLSSAKAFEEDKKRFEVEKRYQEELLATCQKLSNEMNRLKPIS